MKAGLAFLLERARRTVRKASRGSTYGAVVGMASLVTICASCSNDDDAGARCGEGTVLQGSECVAMATDGGLSNGDVKAPTFGGVTALAPASPTRLLVTWDAAKDERTSAANLRYRVFASKTGTTIDYQNPLGTTHAGSTFFWLDGLEEGAEYAVAVRAVNEAGLEDTNDVVKTGVPSADGAPPTFGGVQTATDGGDGAVELTWEPASDDLSPAAAISYAVYVGTAPKSQDLSAPILVTPPGARSALVRGLVGAEITRYFVVRARDAADNMDDNTVELAAQPGKDVTAPTFGGCTAAITTSASTATVSWNAAVDETTPAAQIRYEIFEAATSGAQDFTKPVATVEGVTAAQVTNLTPTTKHWFVCRARDLADNVDANRVERSTTTTADPQGPTFAGISSIDFDAAARHVTFTWNAASDDLTPPERIVYDVYESTSAGGQDFAATPRASSEPGATSVTVTNLKPDSTLYWVVRARDEGLNHDLNVEERSGTTNVSFSQNVQHVFNRSCAVVGCHVPGNPASGLVLTQGFAYAQLVDVPAAQSPTWTRVVPGSTSTSYLYEKIVKNPPPVGSLMPAPSTQSVLAPADIDAIRRWIEQGATNN